MIWEVLGVDWNPTFTRDEPQTKQPAFCIIPARHLSRRFQSFGMVRKAGFFIAHMKTEITTTNHAPTMSSLQIAEITGKEHKNVLADIRRIFAEAGIEDANFLAPHKMPSGQKTTVYNLPRRECDLVMTGYSAKYRLAIIDRWQELEAKQAFNIPATYSEALRLAADLDEKNRALALENQEMKPKADFYDTVTASKTVCQMAVAAQVLKLPFGRNILFRMLREDGIFISGGERHNLPKQQFIFQGLFTVEQSHHTNSMEQTFVTFTTHVTQKGLDWLRKHYGDRDGSEGGENDFLRV